MNEMIRVNFANKSSAGSYPANLDLRWDVMALLVFQGGERTGRQWPRPHRDHGEGTRSQSDAKKKANALAHHCVVDIDGWSWMVSSSRDAVERRLKKVSFVGTVPRRVRTLSKMRATRANPSLQVPH